MTLNQGQGASKCSWGGSTASTVCFDENLIQPKMYHTNVLFGVKHIFWPVIWIQKDLCPMCFWSHGQSFSGKVNKTKVVVHLPSSKVSQVLTPTLIPLPLPRVGYPKWGLRNFAASKHPPSCE